MSRRYRVFPTPQNTIDYIYRRLTYTRRNREFWSIETASETYHGFGSEKQAKAIAKSIFK